MGNETSSMKIHSLLTAEDLKALRAEFPGGGATPVTNLQWGAWKQCWPQDRLFVLEKSFLQSGNLSFQGYQELAGKLVRGTAEERAKLILASAPNAQVIKASQLLAFIEDINDIFTSKQDHTAVAQSLLHDLVFNGESRKSCLYKKPDHDPELTLDAVERWMVMSAPIFDRVMQHALAKSFGLTLEPSLLPAKEITHSNSRLKCMEVVFLNSALNHEYRDEWRLLFNSR